MWGLIGLCEVLMAHLKTSEQDFPENAVGIAYIVFGILIALYVIFGLLI